MAKETIKKTAIRADDAEKEEAFFNPIDEDKIAENPHLLPYAHERGGMSIKPIDKGRVKGQAVSAMYEQTDTQLSQIREQVALLAAQAQKIHDRVVMSEKIYQAEMNFKPLMMHTYHLYEKQDGVFVLSMIGPNEWGRRKPYKFLYTAKLMSDHTWDMLDSEE
jgi:hypothetical protein